MVNFGYTVAIASSLRSNKLKNDHAARTASLVMLTVQGSAVPSAPAASSSRPTAAASADIPKTTKVEVQASFARVFKGGSL
eukprot:5224310-Amphidinium_carterae.1